MSYLKLLGARRKSGAVPSMRKTELSEQQKAWTSKGLCVKCGQIAAAKGNYLCQACQAEDTIDEIRDDINVLRRKLLKNQE